MNLQNIKLEYIKAFMIHDYLIIAILIFLLIMLTVFLINLINDLSSLSNIEINKILNGAIILLITSIIILTTNQIIINRTKDHYKATIKNQKTIEINKNQYNFLEKLKIKESLGEKITKDEFDKAKAILTE